MPELPDILAYRHALDSKLAGRLLESCQLLNPFFLRSVDVSMDDLVGRPVTTISHIGKRLVIRFEGDLHAVIHLMIAGRLRWIAPGKKPPGRISLARFSFEHGSLVVTEAGSKKRASLHIVKGDQPLMDFDRGGFDPMTVSIDEFSSCLRCSKRTLKRLLTDPTVISGIGNAYSDEILHAAGLSPFKTGAGLAEDECEQLHAAMQAILNEWITRLKAAFERKFPGAGDVTAFRPEFSVHGKYGQPCPVCQAEVQRICFADREFNYCPRCQTNGRLLADRSLSRLLGDDWPKTIDDV